MALPLISGVTLGLFSGYNSMLKEETKRHGSVQGFTFWGMLQTCLCLDFLFCKMKLIIVSHRYSWDD